MQVLQCLFRALLIMFDCPEADNALEELILEGQASQITLNKLQARPNLKRSADGQGRKVYAKRVKSLVLKKSYPSGQAAARFENPGGVKFCVPVLANNPLTGPGIG